MLFCDPIRENHSTTMAHIRYAHTNLVARDWRILSQFYQDVLECIPVGVERDYIGDGVDKITGMQGVRVQGQHLRLPGHGDTGPTLEIFQYTPQSERWNLKVDGPGFAHLAFIVDDLQSKRMEILQKGGKDVGEVQQIPIEGEGLLTLLYIEDPEGNVLELQQWKRP
jgi:catechol 2,3-dioxygenase-like lactoylglutathione lyase family enzyme